MLPDAKLKNSWVLSVENKETTKYTHHFFCTCSGEFKLQTEINEPEAADVLCPICGNDYFKDAVVFENMKSTKIWKYFKWMNVVSENKDCWNISLKYETPIYNDISNEVKLNNKDLLHIKLKKDGSVPYKISYSSKIISQYSLFLDDKVQTFKKLLVDEAKENLFNYVMMSKSKSIEWIDDDEIKEFFINDKLNYLTFFLKNFHLKEHRFFFWKMELLHHRTVQYPTQVEMLEYIANFRQGKSVKKALYQGYENSLQSVGYYPYSDHVFSRGIDDINLLVKLYQIHPVIKQEIFTDETFSVALEFLEFLKKYYSQIQITKLFTEEMQDSKEYKRALLYWKDTLRMLGTYNAFDYLEEHFIKVKIATKTLHDEIVRIFHIVSYVLDSKESFDYDEKYLSACREYEELEFKLPLTVQELSLWSKMLHNCMFGYSKKIHQQKSVIYGVFKDEELLYAVELSNFKIVQAKAVSNRAVPDDDMKIIRDWHIIMYFKI